MSPRITSHLGRYTKPVLSLLVVAVLAVPVVDAANRLSVHVDGDVLDVLSFEATVADVLDEQGVELAAGDEVLPAPATPVDGVDAITVLRTIDVTLVVDGEVTTHRGTWRTVGGMLADVGVDVAPAQVLRPGPRAVLEDGDRITVDSPDEVTVVTEDGDEVVMATHLSTVGEVLDSLGVELDDGQGVRPTRDETVHDGTRITVQPPVEVTVTADGEQRTVQTYTLTVGALLDELGVEVGSRDELEPGRGTELADGAEVVVRRVTFEEETVEVAVPFEEERRGTGELYEGDSRVVTEGADGVRVETYRVRLVDGETAGRVLTDEELVTEPLTRVVEVGTKERPPPPPPPTGSSVWYDLARCESGGRWSYDGPSGYDGGLQFHPSTWSRNKPAGYPDYAWQATPGQQIEVGKIVQRRSGWGAWPSCAAKLGLI